MRATCLPCVLRQAARRASTQVEAGTPLGWASPSKQHAFNLRPGSTAVFYSDGLVENRNRGLDAGLEELAAVAAGRTKSCWPAPNGSSEYLVERMLAGHEQDDDVTVLVMHVPTGRSAMNARGCVSGVGARAEAYKSLPAAAYGDEWEAGGLNQSGVACHPAKEG